MSGKPVKNPSIEVPDHLKHSMRKALLAQLDVSTVDSLELELFKWYVGETEGVLNGMLAAERKYVQEQVFQGAYDVNDSGMVAVEYYTKRIRYSHVIYLTSLLETSLDRACKLLTLAIGDEKVPFGLAELSGDQWSKKRRFLERYGRFELPKDVTSEIQVVTSLRNYLVHDNGSTSAMSAADRESFSRRPGIEVDGYEVRIDDEFVRHALEAVSSFVGVLETRLKEAIARAQRPTN